MRSKIKIFASFFIIAGFVLGIGQLVNHNVNAASSYSLISNSAYLDKNSMSRAKIQSFLESKKSTLATYTDQGMNDSRKISAAEIIYNAAQAWGINPQVILATLQKEQSLITYQNPPSYAYRSAMGYGCPDNADCNKSYYGFANQVNIASYQFRYNYEALKGKSSFIDGDSDAHGVGSFACNQSSGFYDKPLLPGNTVTFKRNTVVRGTSDKTVKIANEGTASFLCYTPHVGPYSTTGYSGSDNFVYFFNLWFGDPRSERNVGSYSIQNRYDALTSGQKSSLGSASGAANCGSTSSSCWQLYQNGAIIWSKNTGAWESYGPLRARWEKLGFESGQMGYPTGPVITSGKLSYQSFQNGYIVGTSSTGYWESKGGIRQQWEKLGFESGKMGYPTGPEVATKTGWYQQYEHGYILGSLSTRFYESTNPIRARWEQLGFEDGEMGYPVASVITLSDKSSYQEYQYGYIIGTPSTGYWESKGAIRQEWVRLGYQNGKLGWPTGPEVTTRDGWYQNYQGGRLYYENYTYRADYK